MLDIAVTGGIGSGKSTVAEMLAAKGAVHLNADAIVHELQQPGGAVFNDMVEHFGEGIVGEDGTLNRQAVADIVFNDESHLKALNEIVHPEVRAEMQRMRDRHLGQGSVVISEIPLLVESRLKADKAAAGDEAAQEASSPAEQATAQADDPPQPNFAGIVVVTASHEVVMDRLLGRGVSEEDAKSRMNNQASNEERLAIADFVIDNSGTRSSLESEVDRCWNWIMKLAAESKSSTS